MDTKDQPEADEFRSAAIECAAVWDEIGVEALAAESAPIATRATPWVGAWRAKPESGAIGLTPPDPGRTVRRPSEGRIHAFNHLCRFELSWVAAAELHQPGHSDADPTQTE